MDRVWILGHCRRDACQAKTVCVVLAFVPGGVVCVGDQQCGRQILKGLGGNRRDIGIA